MSDVYLKAWHGGLGDALQFSTLPEEFSKQQDRKTYIVADAPFRNEGIYDLVWDKNPYVLGKKFGEWNAGDLPSIPYREDGFLEENGTRNMISNWGKFHGLQPTNKYPKVIKEVRGKGLLIGLCLHVNQAKFIQKLLDNNLLTVLAAENVVRLLPPLNVKKQEIDLAVNIIRKVCENYN